jgi:beta-ureidopropionase / N-carbamoyl-L-amino-acid hydrolase
MTGIVTGNLRIDIDRLMHRLRRLGEVGARPDGGVSRLALSDADRQGRDLVVGWMHELGLAVTVDGVGNIVAVRPGRSDGAPVMTGSHIDTVRAGGLYDGNLGVLGGLEVVEALNAAGIETERPLAVAIFTNEEGARFAPDMLGSLVYVGGLGLDEALETRAIDGARLGDELRRAGYAGEARPGWLTPHAFVELHIEQGPVLEAEGVTIGAVENLQGISWQEVSISGTANHAGTTPMRLRHDAGYAAAWVATKVREITRALPEQVGTVGVIKLEPELINVIASKASFTVDLRNTDEARLQQAEEMLTRALDEITQSEGVTVTRRSLARFEPVTFDAGVADLIARTADGLGYSTRRMTSGAGHDAQMLARICPTAMIFTPSVAGISHNPREHTEPGDLEAGANVLLHVLLELANG